MNTYIYHSNTRTQTHTVNGFVIQITGRGRNGRTKKLEATTSIVTYKGVCMLWHRKQPIYTHLIHRVVVQTATLFPYIQVMCVCTGHWQLI